ncbi:MAG: hypothetical protein J6589_03785 [Snodgrassella sp.]|uniref:hypothetical protein n=1 Tax=Snodgrassella TaxID=1193515 RepID=UPI001EF62D1D|nr:MULTISPECIES: hypothetical protein [Snodgrassella]MCO6513570.1 hypothetical protein [Snodgrassella sp.]
MHQCQATKWQSFTHHTDKILTILKRSYQSYEGKRIRFTRQQTGISVSRRDRTQVMKSLSLISNIRLNVIKNTRRQAIAQP